MSLLPLIFSDWWEDLERPHHLMDQNFGLGLNPEQLLTIPNRMDILRQRERFPMSYYRPWAELIRQKDSGTSTVNADKDKFQVVLDVQQFQPNELDVKVTDKFVVVTAKHEEKRDEHGWISRQFVRKYIIPEQCDIDQVTSKLSSDGVLTIIAPRKEVPKIENERTIKIEHTGRPAMQTKSQKQPEKQEQEQQQQQETNEEEKK
ncbi:protein lethal(2)essential for life-like [Vespa mandarinia]|uniref:protein lethal(2)essential for life-like n=1 Tax=Vespa mandarinia TaxID=7446 RepID=UPI001607CAEB|nr:protein lethal(2)essential for life-like [Vespa mandarinia]